MLTVKKETEYKKHINGLKGFACVMVMIGHYIGLYKYAESFPVKNGILELFDEFLNSKISFIIDETFWVILFFVVSGYLVSQSSISSITDLIKKSVFRFLRLGLPVFAACFIIFIISETVGFYTSQTVPILENSFIQKPYNGEITFLQVMLSPIDVLFLGKVSLNGPYWVLREMFLTSLIIYLFSLLRNKLSNKTIYFLLVTAVFVLSMCFSNVVFAGIFGMIIALFEKDKDSFLNHNIPLLMIIVFCAALYFIPRSRIACIFFAALIVIIPRIKLLNCIFSSKIALFINKISFGGYSFHWPILLSVGMLVLIKTQNAFGLINACVISVFVSVILTVLMSILYYYLLEQYIYKFIKMIQNKWR